MASVAQAAAIGLDHYFAGRKMEAEEIFRRILDVAPDHPPALRMAGVLAGERGALTEAADLLRRAWRQIPDDADVARNLAQALSAGCRQEEADAVWAAIAPLVPAESEALAAAARAARRAGLEARAYTLQRRRTRLQLDTSSLFDLARDAARLGQAHVVLAAQRGLLAVAPWLDDVCADIATAHADLIGPEAAWRLFDRAARLDPKRLDHRAALWRARRNAGLGQEYHSAEGQDALVHGAFFPTRRDGFFVDLGAFDGVTWSNSLFFEKELGWSGLCVEASPNRHADYCASGRKAPCLNVAVGGQDGEAAFLEVVSGMLMTNGLIDAFAPEQRAYVERNADEHRVLTVPVRRLDGLLQERGVDHVDFLTMDVEGAERAVIESLDFGAVRVDVMCLENQKGDPALRELLNDRGYDFVWRFDGGDEIFVRRGFSPAS